jgi:hypothetical protein
LYIAAQPQDLALPAGSNALFTVGAVGISPMSYQWQYNGVSLPDATGSNLFLADVKTSNAGSYSVVVANPAASVVSASAFLTVLAVPDITTQPSGATLSYQWRLNGAPIAGATGTTLTLTNAQPPDAGDYSAVITNYAGSVTSAVGTLIVLVPPGVTLQPVSQTVPVGATVSFSVAAEGTIPLNYQWQFNGTTLESALSPGLLLTNVQVAQAGVYLAEISNAAGTTNSAAALLKVIDQPLLLNARMTNGAFGFTLSGIEGQIYVIDVSTNLPDWTPLTTLSNSAALTDFVDFTSSNSVSRFYRARWAQ